MRPDDPGEDLVFQLAVAMQESLAPVIRDPERLEPLRAAAAEKGDGHLAYELDVLAHGTLAELLDRHGFRGELFSEEGDGVRGGTGGDADLLICDPYDNTSLTVGGFRDSSVALTLVDAQGDLKSAAIADLQIGRIVWASSTTPTQIVQRGSHGEWRSRPARVSGVAELRDARVAVSLMKRKRRVNENHDLRLVPEVGTLFSVDGAMMIARVAIGELEAYVDSFVGQPIYEIPCCELIRRAGGIVTDRAGREFSLRDVVAELRRDPASRQPVVCAGSPEVHAAILTLLSHNGGG